MKHAVEGHDRRHDDLIFFKFIHVFDDLIDLMLAMITLRIIYHQHHRLVIFQIFLGEISYCCPAIKILLPENWESADRVP